MWWLEFQNYIFKVVVISLQDLKAKIFGFLFEIRLLHIQSLQILFTYSGQLWLLMNQAYLCIIILGQPPHLIFNGLLFTEKKFIHVCELYILGCLGMFFTLYIRIVVVKLLILYPDSGRSSQFWVCEYIKSPVLKMDAGPLDSVYFLLYLYLIFLVPHRLYIQRTLVFLFLNKKVMLPFLVGFLFSFRVSQLSISSSRNLHCSFLPSMVTATVKTFPKTRICPSNYSFFNFDHGQYISNMMVAVCMYVYKVLAYKKEKKMKLTSWIKLLTNFLLYFIFIQKLKDAERQRINELEELEKKANIQLERQLVMASYWSRALLTMRGKLRGTEWDPENSHRINFSDFLRLLNSNNVQFMEYSNYGQTISGRFFFFVTVII